MFADRCASFDLSHFEIRTTTYLAASKSRQCWPTTGWYYWLILLAGTRRLHLYLKYSKLQHVVCNLLVNVNGLDMSKFKLRVLIDEKRLKILFFHLNFYNTVHSTHLFIAAPLYKSTRKLKLTVFSMLSTHFLFVVLNCIGFILQRFGI